MCTGCLQIGFCNLIYVNIYLAFIIHVVEVKNDHINAKLDKILKSIFRIFKENKLNPSLYVIIYPIRATEGEINW